jgi:rod shape determining protein RodA
MKRKYLILIPIICLITISLYYLPNSYKIKQFLWANISLLLLIILSKLKTKSLLKYSELIYILSIIALIFVLVFNKFTNGSRGWINLGIISFQPSEIMKIALILISLKYLNKIDNYLFILLYIIPMILIFLEPDTGGVIMDLIILMVFLFHQLKPKQYFRLITITTLFIIIGILIYHYNTDLIIKILGPQMFYRIDRISSFTSNNNLQSTNALISIASGKTLYFPEMFNDFFIAYILSKNIWMIIPIIICTIWILLWLINKNTLIAQVVFYLFLWQFWWNLAMNLNLVPVIGIPYLFLSYGGSHILSSSILIGLVLSNKDDYNSHNKGMVDT